MRTACYLLLILTLPIMYKSCQNAQFRLSKNASAVQRMARRSLRRS